MHTAYDNAGNEIMEYDETFTGTVTVTYIVKADSIDDANRCLKDIAASLARTGVTGISSGGKFKDVGTDRHPNVQQVEGGFDGRLKKSVAGKARSKS